MSAGPERLIANRRMWRCRCALRWRPLFVEQFERRILLTSAADEPDPNGASFRDPQAIIDYIDYWGAGPVSRDASGLGQKFDLDGDGQVTPRDIVRAIIIANAEPSTTSEDEDANDSTGTGPPDTMGAVGPEQIVEMLNTGYTVYDKYSRKPLAPTIDLDDFWNVALAREPADEVQRLTFSGAITGGDFTIQYGPIQSQPIPWSDQPDVLRQNIQVALDGLFEAGNAVASEPSGGQDDITFGDGLAGADLLPLVVDDNLTGGSVGQSTVINGTGNAVKQFSFSSDVRGGTFVLQYDGLLPQTVAWSADSRTLLANVRSALDTMFGANNVGAVPTSDGQIVVIFGGAYSGTDGASLIALSELLEKKPVAIGQFADSTQSQVERVTFAGPPDQFSIQYGYTPLSDEYSNTGSTDAGTFIQTALDQFFGTGNAVVLATGPDQFDITYGGTLANTALEGLRFYGNTVSTSVLVHGSGNEVQHLDAQALYYRDGDRGTLTLTATINGVNVSAPPIPFDTNLEKTRQDIERALSAETLFGPGNVKVLNYGEGQFQVVFCGMMARAHWPLIQMSSSLLGYQPTWEDASGEGNETQRLTFGGGVDGGWALLEYGTAQEAVIQYSSNPTQLAGNIQAAANTMFGLGNTVVSQQGFGQFDITFVGQLAQTNIDALSVYNGLTGSNPNVALATVLDGAGNEMQELVFPDRVNGGSLTISGAGTSQTIAGNLDPISLQMNFQKALDAMFGTTGSNPVMHNALALIYQPNQLDIVFHNQLAGFSVPLLTVAADNLTYANLIFRGTVTGPGTTSSFPGDSRVIYDPASGRWFASALGSVAGHAFNQILLAVSHTSDPRDGWTGFVFLPDPARADSEDFPQLGINADGVYIVANMIPRVSSGFSATALIVAPKADLLLQTPSVDHATVEVLRAPDYVNTTAPVMPGFGTQPIVDFGPAAGAQPIIGPGLNYSGLGRYDVYNAAGPGAATIDGTTAATVHTAIGARLHLTFSLAFPPINPPNSTFYIDGNDGREAAVTWSADWVTLRDNLQAALDQIFGSGNAAIVGLNQASYGDLDYYIYFSAELPANADRTIAVLGSGSTWAIANSDQISDEVQRLTLDGGITGGSFMLKIAGQTSQTVAWDGDHTVLLARIRAAIDALVGPGSAAVLNGAGNSFDIKFGGSLAAKDVAQLTADVAGLIGSGISVQVATTIDGAGTAGFPLQPDGDALVEPDGGALRSSVYKQGGSFWLAYTGGTGATTITTQPIQFSADQAATQTNIQAALNDALGTGSAVVNVSGSSQYDIQFLGPFSDSRMSIKSGTLPAGFSLTGVGSYPQTTMRISVSSAVVGSTVALQLVQDGREMVRWVQIDAATNEIMQAGNITDPNLAFYYPSIAVNAAGDVVIGFSGSGSTQYPSAFYAIGHTVDGHTAFDVPRLLQPGAASFDGRWGDYSATVLDPIDPTVFWTFQEYTVADNRWGVKVAAIRASSPDPSRYLLMHNSRKPLDVDGDGVIAPRDAADVIIYLNAFGASTVSLDALGTPYCDVDGDGVVAPKDSVAVIDYLNAYGAGEGEADQASGDAIQESERPPSGVGDVMLLLAMDVAAEGQKKKI